MKRAVLVAAMASLSLIVTATPSRAGHSYHGYHWERQSNPFTVVLGDNVDGNWDGHLAAVASDWTASGVLDTAVASGGADSSCNPKSGRVEVCNGAYGSNGWLGLATLWVTFGHIRQATVKVNDSYLTHGPYANPYTRQHVLCQEVGHALGLAHRTGQTCMDDHNLSDPAATDPDAHDYEQLEGIYAHTDGKERGRPWLSLRLPQIRFPTLRMPGLRIPTVRVPSVQIPSLRAPIVRVPAVRLPSVSDPVIAPRTRPMTIVRVAHRGDDVLVLQVILPVVVTDLLVDDRAAESRARPEAAPAASRRVGSPAMVRVRSEPRPILRASLLGGGSSSRSSGGLLGGLL